jgi:hypothetical protein
MSRTSNFASLTYSNTSIPAGQVSVDANPNLQGVVYGLHYWRVCARPTATTCGAWSTPQTVYIAP